MNFGEAIEALKAKRKVQREGWNGKGMYIFLVEPVQLPNGDDFCCLDLPPQVQETWEMRQRPTIVMKDATDHLVIGWLASQTDMLADDWQLVPADTSSDPKGEP
jgi:hypothetical protein